jgi:hypothetical protein
MSEYVYINYIIKDGKISITNEEIIELNGFLEEVNQDVLIIKEFEKIKILYGEIMFNKMGNNINNPFKNNKELSYFQKNVIANICYKYKGKSDNEKIFLKTLHHLDVDMNDVGEKDLIKSIKNGGSCVESLIPYIKNVTDRKLSKREVENIMYDLNVREITYWVKKYFNIL